MSEQHPLFQKVEQARRRQGKVHDTEITLAHDSGGKAMRDVSAKTGEGLGNWYAWLHSQFHKLQPSPAESGV